MLAVYGEVAGLEEDGYGVEAGEVETRELGLLGGDERDVVVAAAGQQARDEGGGPGVGPEVLDAAGFQELENRPGIVDALLVLVPGVAVVPALDFFPGVARGIELRPEVVLDLSLGEPEQRSGRRVEREVDEVVEVGKRETLLNAEIPVMKTSSIYGSASLRTA